jgi:thiamine-phosphate pyrophosphorylase
VKPLSECQLYTFVDFSYLRARSAVEITRRLCDGGSDLIQLRAKGISPSEILCLAETLLPITERAGVGLVINDYPEVALTAGAPLCHLGQEDLFASGKNHVRQLLSPNSGLKIGLSSHAPAQARRAVDAGADYIAVGPVFRTDTKPLAQPVTLKYVRWAAAHLRAPWFAIGGIDLHNLDAVLMAGARRICVVSAILNAVDIVQACQAFKKRLSSVPIESLNCNQSLKAKYP